MSKNSRQDEMSTFIKTKGDPKKKNKPDKSKADHQDEIDKVNPDSNESENQGRKEQGMEEGHEGQEKKDPTNQGDENEYFEE